MIAKQLPLFRVPLLWLFLGPPAFRAWRSRWAMASVTEGQDFWNILRIVYWLLVGFFILIELTRNIEAVKHFLREMGFLPVAVAIWISGLYASALVSPSVTFTAGNATFMLILVLGALDLGAKLYAGQLSIRRLFQALLYISLTMLMVVWVAFQIDPYYVGFYSFGGIRIRGNAVAYVPILAQVLFFGSLYFLITSRRRGRWFFIGLMAMGVWWISIGQTRSSYLGFGLGVLLFILQTGYAKQAHMKLTGLFVATMIGLCCLGVLYGSSHTIRWKLDRLYDRYVLRDAHAIQSQELATEHIMSLNGRTRVAAVLWENALFEPLGVGYIAGPRQLLQSEDITEILDSKSFGNAHNAFLEIWAGAGFITFFAFVIFMISILWHSRNIPGVAGILIRVLLYILLIEGLFESNLVLPFKQNSSLLWTLTALIMVSRTHRRLAVFGPEMPAQSFPFAGPPPPPPPTPRPMPPPAGRPRPLPQRQPIPVA